MGVSENGGTPKSSILIGFSIIFTIHFGVFPLFLETPKLPRNFPFRLVKAEACHQHLDFGSKIGTFDPRAHWCHAREARCGSGALELGDWSSMVIPERCEKIQRTENPKWWWEVREMGPLIISGKARLVKYDSIWPDLFICVSIFGVWGKRTS